MNEKHLEEMFFQLYIRYILIKCIFTKETETKHFIIFFVDVSSGTGTIEAINSCSVIVLFPRQYIIDNT